MDKSSIKAVPIIGGLLGINPPNTVEELYTAVKKKPKGSQPKDEEETPPIPSHTIEELYTAVEKKPKSIPDENKEEAPTQSVLQNVKICIWLQ